MNGTNARSVALELLLRIEVGGAYLDRVLSAPSFRALDSRDRAFARELVAGVERWKLRLDRIIDMYYTKPADSLSPEIRAILRLGFYQLMFLDSVPPRAAVHESVEMAGRIQGKGAGGLVNALLRRFTREGEPRNWPVDSAEHLAVFHSYPLWLSRRWTGRYGRETADEIMRAGNERHPMFVRVNPLRANPETLPDRLSEHGISAAPVREMPGYLSLSASEGLFDTPPFLEGLFTVQDPSAGLATMLLSPRPGETVLDLCAAPGGKTTHLAEQMGDTGTVVALDIHAGRLRMVRQAASRLGLRSVETVEGDARSYGDSGQYDRVLLDAPCMGTAVFAKRPDMKWSRREEDIPRLVELQHEMLDNAARLVRPGGWLVYSTCSLEPEEDVEQVADFLGRHPEFVQVSDPRFEMHRSEIGYLVLPHRMYGSGAFAAGMKRV